MTVMDPMALIKYLIKIFKSRPNKELLENLTNSSKPEGNKIPF